MTDAWYTYEGQDNDVIVATRVRLARNLADFPSQNTLGREMTRGSFQSFSTPSTRCPTEIIFRQ